MKAFGVAASGFPAFHRVVKGLQSEQGRHKVLQCLRARAPLAGRPGDSSAEAGVEGPDSTEADGFLGGRFQAWAPGLVLVVVGSLLRPWGVPDNCR